MHDCLICAKILFFDDFPGATFAFGAAYDPLLGEAGGDGFDWRSDLPISFATNFCETDGFCCITRNTAISSKVQFLHFDGSPRAKFALVSVGEAPPPAGVLNSVNTLNEKVKI